MAIARMRPYRLFQYRPNCVLRGKVIDLVTAAQRGLVDVDSVGRVIRVSDDLQDLGPRSELGHRRQCPEAASSYFDR